MAHIVDTAAVTVITFLLTFVWTTAVLTSWAAVFAVSAAVALMSAVTVVYIRRGSGKHCSCERFSLECALRPPSYLISLLRPASTARDLTFGDDHILTPDAVIFASAKLGTLGMSDLNSLAEKAERLSRKRVYFIARAVDRRAYRVMQYREIRLSPVKLRTVYRWLKKHDALPDLKRIKPKFSPAAFFEAAFRRSNLKNYLFSGFILVAVAFLTPLRIYYLIFGSISLIMALLTLTPLGKGPFGGEKIFDGLCAAPETSSEGEGNSGDGAEPSENAADKADKIPSDGGRGNKSDGTPADGE